jgi:hypothetical protein
MMSVNNENEKYKGKKENHFVKAGEMREDL